MTIHTKENSSHRDLCQYCVILNYVDCPILAEAITEGYAGLTECKMYETLKKFIPLLIENKLGKSYVNTELSSNKNTKADREANPAGSIRQTPEIF